MNNRHCKTSRQILRLGWDRNGVTAIEFALLAPILFPLVFSLFELGLLYTKLAMLDHAISNSAKTIYVGHAATGSVTKTDIEEQICRDMVIGGTDCTDNLIIELITVSGFGSLPTSEAVCRDSDVALNPAAQYSPGMANEIVFLRACFMSKLLTPGIGYGLRLPATEGGKYALIASTAFANEPF